jgi:SOS regulatory protein LexA
MCHINGSIEYLFYRGGSVSQDQQYLDKLRDYFAQNHTLPSFSAIASLLGLKSTSSVSALAARLKLQGFLDAGPDKRLTPGKRFFEREILDSVRAGLPEAANESSSDILTIDDFLIRSPSRTVLLRVKGDSMIDAGLMEGDTMIVEKGAPARSGDIVVAIVDNEFTVKYLDVDSKTKEFYLRPGNKAYPNIRPQTSLELFGKVVGQFRKYG